MKTFETVIGLEVHLQLKTKTKIFCGCANTFGNEPNTQTCPVCLGLPGSLPVLNKMALYNTIKAAMALNCQVNPLIKFDRKNYYYPDLPKGYQISQNSLPIASDGHIFIGNQKNPNRIGIKRTHLEEDAGKLIHDPQTNCTLVDYNRTGTPLIEIVSDPGLHSPEEAHDYLTTLKLILQYLDISDCDMEKGSLRCDANVSLREKGQTPLGTKVEIKNLNSFKAVKSALEFEQERQQAMLESGERITQETRLWNDEKGITSSMRSKEEAHDYRYFPEPDLVPFVVEQTMIEEIRGSLPELPHQKLGRFRKDYALSDYDAQILIQDKSVANFFEECTKIYPHTKKICNWIIGPLLQELNTRKVEIKNLSLTPKNLTLLIASVEKGVISNLAAKDIFPAMIDTGQSADEIISKKGLAQISDESALIKIIDDVLKENPSVVEQIKQGKESAMGFLVGQSMKKSQGKANPKILGDIIKRRLANG